MTQQLNLMINQAQLHNDQPDWRLEDAYRQGQVDFHTHIRFPDCPYTDDDLRDEWQRGWIVEQLDIVGDGR